MTSRARKGHTERRESRLVAVPEEVPQQTPLDFALAVMRDDTQSDALRAGMAKAVLPYLHKRGEEGDDEPESKSESAPMSDLELARRVAFILKLGERQLDGEGEDKSPPRHSPPADAGQPSVTPCAPLNEERAQRNDEPDPHAAYRWIP